MVSHLTRRKDGSPSRYSPRHPYSNPGSLCECSIHDQNTPLPLIKERKSPIFLSSTCFAFCIVCSEEEETEIERDLLLRFEEEEMKGCDLCDSPARMYCESDRASLCWECDAKVHCANFLVARHSRSLLCHACQSPTPWQASGPKLGPIVSVCDKCIERCGAEDGEAEEENHNEDDEDVEEDEDDDDDDDDDDDTDGGGDGDISDDDDDDEEDGDNQVVPWTCATPPPPPPTASSSSSDEFSGRFSQTTMTTFPMKRVRENDGFQDEFCCSSSSEQNYNALMTKEEDKYFGSLRPSKEQRDQTDSKSIAILSSLKRFEQKISSSGGAGKSSAILGICKLSQDPSVAIHLVSPS